MTVPPPRTVRFGLVIAAVLVLSAVALLFLFKGGGHGEAAGPGAPAGQPSAIEVPVTPVVKKTVPIYLDYVGTTTAIRSVTLQAQVTGYLLTRAVPDGADVKAGELLYQIDPSTYQAALDQATAQSERDAAALDYAKANHHRTLVLSKTGDTSIDALQQASSAEHQDSAALAADRAAIETAQLNLSRTAIRAPFAGRLSLTQVYEGALITTAGTALNTLVQLDPIYATFDPPDTDLPDIQQHQATAPIPVEVVVAAGATRHYDGKLTFLDNSVGRSTGTITAQATIANPDRTLLPGQFIRVRLHIADQPDALLVPQTAVGSSQLGKYVYVVGPGDKVEQAYLTLGATDGPLVVVTKGVSENQSVIVGNLLRIGPGMPVKPVPATSAQQAGASRGSG